MRLQRSSEELDHKGHQYRQTSNTIRGGAWWVVGLDVGGIQVGSNTYTVIEEVFRSAKVVSR